MENLEIKKSQLKDEIAQARALLTRNIDNCRPAAYLPNPLAMIPKIADSTLTTLVNTITSLTRDHQATPPTDDV